MCHLEIPFIPDDSPDSISHVKLTHNYNVICRSARRLTYGIFFNSEILIHLSIIYKMVVWERLIRFVATDGRVLRGEPILPSPDFDLGNTAMETKLQARLIVGDDPYDTSGKTKVSDEIVTVKHLLGPLAQDDVPILRCVGLNYAKHSKLPSTLYLSHMLMII